MIRCLNIILLAAVGLLLAPATALAQSAPNGAYSPNGSAALTAPCTQQNDGTCLVVKAANPLPVSVSDGSDITLGAKTDSAWTTGSGSVVALLKALDRDTLLPLAAGSNVIGGITKADGADATLGTKADSAYAGGGGSASVTSLLKGIYTATLAPLSAGSNNIGGVNPDNVADGAVNTNSVSSAAVVYTQPMAGYQGVSFQITSIGSGNTVTFKASNDNSNYQAIYCSPSITVASSGYSQTATATGVWVCSAPMAYIRAEVTTYGSGTVTISTVAKRVLQTAINSQLAAGYSQNLGGVNIFYPANSSGGGTIYALQSAASTAASSVKGSAGRVISWQLSNSAASLRSVKVFNGSPTMGTTPAIFEIDIPAGQTVTLVLEGGMYFGTSIYVAVTSAKGLTDNTSTGLAANDVSGVLFVG